MLLLWVNQEFWTRVNGKRQTSDSRWKVIFRLGNERRKTYQVTLLTDEVHKKTEQWRTIEGKTYSRDTHLWFAINAILNLSNSKNADVSDVMISKRKFDISLDVTQVSLNESECFCFNSRWTNLSSQHWKRESINFRLLFFTSGTSTFSLLKVPSIITSCETVLSPLLSIYPRAHLKRFDWGLVKERLLFEGSIIWQKERLFPPDQNW